MHPGAECALPAGAGRDAHLPFAVGRSQGSARLESAPPADEQNLSKGGEYQLTQTRDKLASQTQVFANALTTIRAKNRFLALLGSRGGKEGSAAAAAGEDTAQDAANAAMVEVQINSDADEAPAAGGCKCIIS